MTVALPYGFNKDPMADWVITHIPCPACGSSDAFSINDAGWGTCFACGYKARVDPDTDTPTKAAPRKGSADLLTDLNYGPIRSRGLTEETCQKFRYGTTTLKDKPVQVAQYVRDGQVVAQKTRDATKQFSVLGNGRGLPLFGQNLWGSTGKMVVVTEGEIDAMSVSQMQEHKWPTVSLPNGAQAAAKTFQDNLEWLEGYAKVIIMFDGDEPGQKAAREAAEILSPGKGCIAQLPLKDANDMLKAGRADEVRRAIWNAIPWRPDAILEGSALLDRVMTHTAPEGLPWPWQGLNGREALFGLTRPGIHTLVAGTGSGKSTICRAIEHYLITQGENIGCIHLEEDAKQTALGIIGYHMGARIDLGVEGVDRAALLQAFHETAGRDGVFFYDSFGSTGVDNLLAKIRYLAKAGGCRYIILDHLSIVVSGLALTDERKAIDQAMTQLRTLVEETKIGLILVSHLSRGEGKDPEKGGEISLKMLRGSQAIAQLSDTVSGLERDQQAEGASRNATLWRGLKCRLTGHTGPLIKLLYDSNTGHLAEVPLSWGDTEMQDDDISAPYGSGFVASDVDDIPF